MAPCKHNTDDPDLAATVQKCIKTFNFAIITQLAIRTKSTEAN